MGVNISLDHQHKYGQFPTIKKDVVSLSDIVRFLCTYEFNRPDYATSIGEMKKDVEKGGHDRIEDTVTHHPTRVCSTRYWP